MNATNKLLDKWIEWRSVKLGGPVTQVAIGLSLGVKQTAVSNYRSGVSQAAPHVIEKMAADLGESPAAWLALVESERAKDAGDRRTWARIAKQLGVAASVAAIGLVAFSLRDHPAALQSLALINALPLGIMRSRRRKCDAVVSRLLTALVCRGYLCSAGTETVVHTAQQLWRNTDRPQQLCRRPPRNSEKSAPVVYQRQIFLTRSGAPASSECLRFQIPGTGRSHCPPVPAPSCLNARPHGLSEQLQAEDSVWTESDGLL